MRRILLLLVMTLVLFADPTARADAQIVDGHRMLKLMGAEGQFVKPEFDLYLAYIRKYRERDKDESWTLSLDELNANRPPKEPAITALHFKFADTDQDGALSQEEFQQMRVIQEEAAAIFERLDANRDARVTSDEFLEGSRIEDPNLAKQVFAEFDAGKDGFLELAEVLPTWDRWARTELPPVTARLVAKQKRYPLPAEYRTEAFRQRITNETDSEKLPPPPELDLVLELTNVGDQTLAVWPGGGIDIPEVTVDGDGLIRPENLEGGGGSSAATTPQPVIPPGKTFRVKVRSLNPEGGGFGNVYWTKPGKYQISASYPVYKNLPPHLPQLFPNQPEPTGKVMRYVVKAPPITVVVGADEEAGK